MGSGVLDGHDRYVADVHDRMLVILRRDDWSDWLDGLPDAAALLCRPYPDLLVKDRTNDRWVQRHTGANE